jgi:hypothetical protein
MLPSLFGSPVTSQPFTQTVLHSPRVWFGILRSPFKCESLLLVHRVRTHRLSSRMADITVEVILKRTERFMINLDRTIGSFVINAAQLTSDGQEGLCGMYLPS